MSKVQRHHQITQLLCDLPISSQLDLVKELEDVGIPATQATVSRDLEELGAVKVRLPNGELIYAIPEYPVDRVLPEDHLRRVMGEWVVEIKTSENIVVLRTPPGSAHVVASALDRAGLPEVLGTVAGDDTLFVVAASSEAGKSLNKNLLQLAGL
ncbi:MAG: arginine repressor [Acidimicrobiaceae bacterium]|jgi:transcriptional regulator of arginine metabolism|nr:arginine repressor [Acidimicrobiaceae bacterium]|tara:strand:+ start:626 stop:1087 length:462 start_codon:yes stop_codon:yes gene_type:complete